MNLFEYQAKELFREAGIPVPQSRLITGTEDIAQAAKSLPLPWMLKAQVLQGGRGKANLIRKAADLQQAQREASDLFASPTGVRTVLVEEIVPFTRELYVSVTVDPVEAKILVLASSSGGVEVETLSQSAPEKLLSLHLEPGKKLLPFQARNLAYGLGLEGKSAISCSTVLVKLFELCAGADAELAEINPLFVTSEGEVIAGDGKIIIDDNAVFRQPRFQMTRDHFSSEVEYAAAQEGIPYLQFDGDISLMCAGAGLTTTVFDLIHDEGSSVANYLEFGGPNYRKAVRAMELCLANPSKVILIVTFGTIARADVMAQGIVDAVRQLKPDRPVVTCIRGTNEEEAFAVLRTAGLEPIFDTEEAVKKAVALTRGEGQV